MTKTLAPSTFLQRPAFGAWVDQCRLGALLVMAASFPFSFALFNIGIVVLIASVILKRVLSRNFFPFDPFMDAALVAYFLISCLSLLGTNHLAMSLQGVHKLLRYLLLFMAARESLARPKDAALLCAAFAAGAAIAAADGLLQYALGTDPIRGQTVHLGFQNLVRLTSCFPNPNTFAIYLSVLFPFIFWVVWSRPERAVRLAGGMLLAAMAACLFMTYARFAAIAMAVNVGLFCLITKNKWILWGFLLLCGMGIFLLPPDVKGWVTHLNGLAEFLVDQGRLAHHQTALNMIADRPWLGVGLNTFDVNYALYRMPTDTFTRWSAHQGYLQMAGETGLLGLGSFLAVLGSVFLYVRRHAKAPQRSFLQACFFGLAGGFAAFLIAGFFESLFWQPRQANFFWFWTGLMCGISKLAAPSAPGD